MKAPTAFSHATANSVHLRAKEKEVMTFVFTGNNAIYVVLFIPSKVLFSVVFAMTSNFKCRIIACFERLLHLHFL